MTHVAVAFDHVVESFRNELFQGYKTGQGVPEDLLCQFDLAERAASALGLVVWPMVEFEADDALAAGAFRWSGAPEVDQVVICSPDKDLMQMVRDRRVVCLDRRRKLTLDQAAVEAKFGVSPGSIPDYLALVGDSADGIPGVPRWGAKATAKVLRTYGHIEKIPEDPSTWPPGVRGAGALASSLAEHRDEAALYKELATLRTDVPLPGGARRPGVAGRPPPPLPGPVRGAWNGGAYEAAAEVGQRRSDAAPGLLSLDGRGLR